MKDSDFPYMEFSSPGIQYITKSRCTRCPICNKVICVVNVRNWVYKTTNKQGLQRILCSWTCYRKAEKEKQSKRQYRSAYEL